MTTARQEQYPDDQPMTLEQQFGGKLCEKLLVTTLRGIADRRAMFRDKLSNQVEFMVGDSDLAEDEVVIEDKEDPERPPLLELGAAQIKMQYSFCATRYTEVINGDEVIKSQGRVEPKWHTMVQYCFMVIMTHRGAELPDPIAVDMFAYDPSDYEMPTSNDEESDTIPLFDPEDMVAPQEVTPEQAIEHASSLDWTKQHTLEFLIDDTAKVLSVRESYSWLDGAGNEKKTACTCNEPGCERSTHIVPIECEDGEDDYDMPDESDEDFDDDGVSEARVEYVPTKWGDVLMVRPKHEELANLDLDEAAEILTMLEMYKLTPKQRADQQDAEVRLAFATISQLDAALKEQAGVD